MDLLRCNNQSALIWTNSVKETTSPLNDRFTARLLCRAAAFSFAAARDSNEKLKPELILLLPVAATERVSKELWVLVKNLGPVMTCDLIQVSAAISALMSVLLQQKHTHTHAFPRSHTHTLTHCIKLNHSSLNKQCYSISWYSLHTNQIHLDCSHTVTKALTQKYAAATALWSHRLSEIHMLFIA